MVLTPVKCVTSSLIFRWKI